VTTLLDFANRAYRVLGVLGAGQVASGNKGEDALQQFQDLVNDMPGLRKGAWTGVIIDSDSAYTAEDGERIHCGAYNPTITLPTTYVDEAGITQPQRDMSRVQIIGGDQEGLWLYSASTGGWAQVDALALADDSPFGPEDDGGMVALLAVALAPEFGEQATLSSVVIERAGRQLRSFRARFRRETSVGVDLAFVSLSDIGTRGLSDVTA
jgi:hypothetical protein